MGTLDTWVWLEKREGRTLSSWKKGGTSELRIPQVHSRLFTLALKDERFQLEEFSPRRVRIRLSDARLEDEGGYFCQLYTEDTHHQIATLTVLGNSLPLLRSILSPFSFAHPLS